MKSNKEIKANAWVICPCGDKHLLKRGIDAPIYWCGNILKKFKAGDLVEYEEITNGISSES